MPNVQRTSRCSVFFGEIHARLQRITCAGTFAKNVGSVGLPCVPLIGKLLRQLPVHHAAENGICALVVGHRPGRAQLRRDFDFEIVWAGCGARTALWRRHEARESAIVRDAGVRERLSRVVFRMPRVHARLLPSVVGDGGAAKQYKAPCAVRDTENHRTDRNLFYLGLHRVLPDISYEATLRIRRSNGDVGAGLVAHHEAQPLGAHSARGRQHCSGSPEASKSFSRNAEIRESFSRYS